MFRSLYGHSFRTQHQAGDVRERVPHLPCCGFLKGSCSVCKKLRKFDDEELERQFVQHHYRPSMYFCVISTLAVPFVLGAIYPICSTTQNLLKTVDPPFGPPIGALYYTADTTFLLSGIGLIVAACIPRIRDSHWDKVALPTAALSFAGVVIFVLANYATSARSSKIEIHTYNGTDLLTVKCDHLLDPSAGIPDSLEAAVCPGYHVANALTNFLLLWLCPLCLPMFGLDFRRYAPLLVTEVIVSVVISVSISLHLFYLYPKFAANTGSLYWEPGAFLLLFTLIVSASLLWASLSSESAGRAAWIRQQNW